MTHRPKSYSPSVVTAFFKSYNIPEPTYEAQFHKTRKWRCDLLFHGYSNGSRWSGSTLPDYREQFLVVEVQGGLWKKGGGRHQRGAAMLKEWEKLNALAEMGYRVVYCQPADLLKRDTAEAIKRALGLA